MAGNVDVYRAALNAADSYNQAAVCLCNCHLFSETLVDGAEVALRALQLALRCQQPRGALTFWSLGDRCPVARTSSPRKRPADWPSSAGRLLCDARSFQSTLVASKSRGRQLLNLVSPPTDNRIPVPSTMIRFREAMIGVSYFSAVRVGELLS